MYKKLLCRLAALCTVLILTVSLAPAGSAANSGMGNFREVGVYPGFSDVPEDVWYTNDVKQACRLGLMGGKGNGLFDPDGNLTLAEAVTIAARIHSIYHGKVFNPGGNPWYQNAVDYAVENYILYEDEYENYTLNAYREDFANILFYALPVEEYPRINRVAWVSDLTWENEYIDEMYTLYAAGVLTGSNTGAFQPDSYITRSQAAAIVARVAKTENRQSLSVTTHAPGEVVTGANGNFKISVPKDQGWDVVTNEVNDDGICEFTCALDNMHMYMGINVYPKSNYTDALAPESVMEQVVLKVLEEDPDYTPDDEGIFDAMFRGYIGYALDYDCSTEDGVNMHGEYFCMENSTQLYIIQFEYDKDNSTDDEDTQLWNIRYSLDIAI